MKHSITKHKQLYSLLNQTGLISQRHDLVFSFTEGRSDDSRELSPGEIEKLIKYLQVFNKQIPDKHYDFMMGDTMRKRILSLCHQYGWTKYDAAKNKNKVDFEALNNWMIKYSYLHKPLNDYKYAELQKLILQFEQVVHNFLKTI